jgi:hypothetical protein
VTSYVSLRLSLSCPASSLLRHSLPLLFSPLRLLGIYILTHVWLSMQPFEHFAVGNVRHQSHVLELYLAPSNSPQVVSAVKCINSSVRQAGVRDVTMYGSCVSLSSSASSPLRPPLLLLLFSPPSSLVSHARPRCHDGWSTASCFKPCYARLTAVMLARTMACPADSLRCTSLLERFQGVRTRAVSFRLLHHLAVAVSANFCGSIVNAWHRIRLYLP